MNKAIIVITLLFFYMVPALSGVYVHGYIRKNGTVVSPYYRSTPNDRLYDNLNEKPHVNLYEDAKHMNDTPEKEPKKYPVMQFY